MTMPANETNWSELLMTDHETTEKVFVAVDTALASEAGPSPGIVSDAIEYFTGYVDQCHNHKEEDHLFPLIESRGIPRTGGPLAVMLAEHRKSEELLAVLVTAGRAFVNGDMSRLGELRTAFEEYSSLLKDHFWKENDILYPMARRVMNDQDVARVLAGIDAAERAIGPDTRTRYYALAQKIIDAGNLKDLSFGLDREVLAAMLNTLPLEVSFVDADDRVQYFSHENQAKIFGRTRGAIGCAVQQCHPPQSVDKVNAILAAFKAGTRSTAEFWIEMGGRKVHIRYHAVRSPEGQYLGCMETVQDITAIQALRGERRLIDEALA